MFGIDLSDNHNNHNTSQEITLTPTQIDAAAQILKKARLEKSVIENIPLEFRPQNLKEAYRVQDRLIEILGLETSGWFCACTNKRIQQILKLDEPYYARLLKSYVFEEPVTLKSEDYPPIVIECEFGFRLGSDLPKRPTPYEREEVEDAICEVHPTIEVVAGHLIDWPNQDVWSVIADNGTDGALIYGVGCKLWRELDLVQSQVSLTVNGKCERTGYGANVLGDPLDALVWLANARSRDGDGLRAGDIHNTGTATDIYWASSGDQIVAEFQSLGKVSLRIS